MQKIFIDTNIWLYQMFDDQRIEESERERKRNIALLLTEVSGLIISTQVANEVAANLLKKAKFNEAQIKITLQSLYDRCQVVKFNLEILEDASDLRTEYCLSFWDSLIVASALLANASILYSEDMQDGLIIRDRLTLSNPFKSTLL